MIKLIFTTIVLITTAVSFGQNSKFNHAYFELGGNGLFLSLNYERQLIPKANIYTHIGFGIYGIKNANFTVPFGIKYLLKLKAHRNFIEFGVGLTYTKADVKVFAIVDNKSGIPIKVQVFNFIPSVCYRQILNKNFIFRAGLTPIFNQYDGIPFIGLSIGKQF